MSTNQMTGGTETTVRGVSVTLDELVSVEPWAMSEVGRGLRLASEAGLLTNVNRVTSEQQAHLFGEPIASFSPPDNILYLSPQNARREWLQWLGDEDVLVGTGITERIIHECIHAEHLQQLEDEEFIEMVTKELTRAEERILEDEVSTYAAEMPSEAVAEIGVLLVRGRKVSPEVRDIYARFDGPLLS